MDWSRVDYLWIIVIFFDQLFELSFWRHPFTAEDPLVSKWCNAEFDQSGTQVGGLTFFFSLSLSLSLSL